MRGEVRSQKAKGVGDIHRKDGNYVIPNVPNDGKSQSGETKV